MAGEYIAMADSRKSEYVFDRGDAVSTGLSIENDYVYVSDSILSDGNITDFSFISGRSLGPVGGGGILTLYDGTSKNSGVIAEFEFDTTDAAPDLGETVSLGFHSSNGSPDYDNVRMADGTIIEDFDACNDVGDYFDSAYSGFQGGTVQPSYEWEIREYFGDCYLVEATTSYSSQIHSSVGHGLQNYPEWGSTILFEVGIDFGRDFGMYLGGDASDQKFSLTYKESNDEFRAGGDWASGTKSFPAYDIPTKDVLWKVEIFG